MKEPTEVHNASNVLWAYANALYNDHTDQVNAHKDCIYNTHVIKYACIL